MPACPQPAPSANEESAALRRRTGFTLIELLVVIAIIAILAAILFPVFAKAREKARQTSCLSNVRQINTAFLAYAQDYDERLPYWSWNHRPGGAWDDPGLAHWYAGIYPYAKNQQIYECPSAARDICHCYDPNARPWAAVTDDGPISYGYNEVMCSDQVKLAAWPQPSQSLLHGDCRQTLGGWAPDADWFLVRYIVITGDVGCGGCPAGLTEIDDSMLPHNGGSNIGFLDGHAKWMKANMIRSAGGGGPIYYWPTQ
jgi:prepilin-type N-terminal cleavage/methylation domain-containing protein/prepilin-type processing-associated H-X9-DG protein